MMILLASQERFFVHLFSWGETKHTTGDFEVNREFYSFMRSSFDYLVNSDDRPPQYPPIKRQHSNDGFVYGLILDVFSTDERKPPSEFTEEGIYIEVAPSKPLAQWRADGLIGNWSPGFVGKWKCPHTGKELRNMLKECSFVSEGHLRNTEKEHATYALSANGFATQMESTKMPEEEDDQTLEVPEEVLERLSGLEERVTEIGEAVASIVATMENDETKTDDDDEPAVENSDTDDVSKRISALEKQLEKERELRTKAEAERKLSDSGIKTTDGERKALVQLAMDKPDAFTATVKMLSDRETKLNETSPSNPYDLVGEVGQVGVVDAGEGASEFHKLCEEVKEEHGFKTSYEAIKFFSAGGKLDLMSEADMDAKTPVIEKVFGG